VPGLLGRYSSSKLKHSSQDLFHDLLYFCASKLLGVAEPADKMADFAEQLPGSAVLSRAVRVAETRILVDVFSALSAFRIELR